jgi:ubiquinone/menaquinone biosynthesis C-methylase UbiE
MKNRFNDLARDWDKNLITKIRTDAISEELRKIIPLKKGQTAMEFGAGTGLLSVALKDLFSEIILIDSSSEMVKVTIEKIRKNKLHHLSPVLFDLEKEDYTIKTFDCIFSQMSLHHVSDIEKIIAKFYKLLNPGGMLAIVDLYKEDGTFHEQEFNGHLGFDPEKLAIIFNKTGFNEISHKPCFEITKSEGPNIGKTYPLFLLVGKKIK